jgi:DNA modification methylase
MIRAIIKQLTKKGDLVIDPCAGNFGVLVACQSLGREFMGCDISVGELLRFNINRENSRALLNATKSEATHEADLKKFHPKYIRNKNKI